MNVNSVAFGSNGARLASGSEDHKINLWDVKQRQGARDASGAFRCRFTASPFSPDGARAGLRIVKR